MADDEAHDEAGREASMSVQGGGECGWMLSSQASTMQRRDMAMSVRGAWGWPGWREVDALYTACCRGDDACGFVQTRFARSLSCSCRRFNRPGTDSPEIR